MIGTTIRPFVFTLLLLAVSAGLTAAHDTGSPHSHELASDHARAFVNSDGAGSFGASSQVSHGLPTAGAPVAFLIVPISGEFFPFHWLWHTMNGEKVDERIHLVHEIMHWFGLPHPHDSDEVAGGDQSSELARYD